MSTLSFINLVIALTIAATICVAMLVFHFYQHNQELAAIAAAKDADEVRLNDLRAQNAAILNTGKGKLGEDAVHQKVLSIFQLLGIACATNREFGIPNAILLPAGNDKFSKEIDLVVVSEIGIFVIEVKDWRGEWAYQTNDQQTLVQINHASSAVNTRPSPMFKTENKLNTLLMRSAIGDIPSEALVVFTDPNCNGHPQLPTNFLHISELCYYFRNKLSVLESSRHVRYGVDSLVNRVKPSLDGSAYALHDHMMRLSPTTPSLQAYQSNHHQIRALETKAPMQISQQRPFTYWAGNAAFFTLLAFAVNSMRSWF